MLTFDTTQNWSHLAYQNKLKIKYDIGLETESLY